ncbi:MAG: ATP-binding protein [Hyphomonadaceae bacterium]|nr:ATP-binding protein [Hyphomonadaceae bacterium]
MSNTITPTQAPLTLTPLSDNAPVALLAVSPENTVRDTNAAAESLLGLSRRRLIDRPLNRVLVNSEVLEDLIEHARSNASDTASPELLIKPHALVDERIVNVRVRWFDSGEVVLALSEAMTREPQDPIAGVASFGRILGHEIKNPLAGISGAAQLLLRQSQPGQRELLTLINDEVARIERLVNRLSAFELFSEPHLEAMNIHELLDKVLASEEAAHDGQLVFVRRYDPSLPDILGDSDHLHEAFQNIVRNGVEAALANTANCAPVVEVSTAFESRFARRGVLPDSGLQRALRVDVSDTGAGMDANKLAHVFEAFSSTKSAGRGLGLTVVKEVVQAHGGQVNIRNIGTGTQVSVFLPLSKTRSK